MRGALVILLAMLSGCSTADRPALPVQPDAPTAPGIVAALGKDWDTADQKVAAAVAIARENATKPEVVKAETTVALSYLPAPMASELALARERAAKADQKQYAQAIDFGKGLLAKLDKDFDKVEKANAEALRVSQLKDKRIADLTAEVERVKKEASENIWTLTGAGLAVIGAIATAFTGPRIGLPLILAGAFCGSVPFIIDSPYFAYIAATTLVLAAGLGLWRLWDYIKDRNADVEAPKE